MSDGQDRPPFNAIFAEFVLEEPEANRVRGLIAYGLYKIAKREWATDLYERERRTPTDADLANYARSWTPSMIEGKIAEAGAILSAYADNVVQAATPAIEKAALQGSLGRAIGYGIAANLAYTLLLVVFVVILKLYGVDILGLAEKIGPPSSPSALQPPPALRTTP